MYEPLSFHHTWLTYELRVKSTSQNHDFDQFVWISLKFEQKFVDKIWYYGPCMSHKSKNFHSHKKISFVFDDFLTIENDKKNILYVKSHQKFLVHFHQISRKPFYLSLFRCQKAFYHCLTLISRVLPNHDSLFSNEIDN